MKRRYSIVLIIAAIFYSCSSKSQLISTYIPSSKNYAAYRLSLQDSIINFGSNYLKTPYRYGGTTPSGFDCSGFTSYVFQKFGIPLKRSSREQADEFQTVGKFDLQKGDLVFFEGRRRNKKVGHVGIVFDKKENGEFDFIHASINNGVTITSSNEEYYAKRFIKGGRVIDNQEIVLNRKQHNTLQTNDKNSPKENTYASSTPTNIAKDAVYHVVKKGDNLSKISKQYDVPISAIQQLNGLKSKRIKKGQKLLILEAVINHQIAEFHAPATNPDEDILTNPENNLQKTANAKKISDTVKTNTPSQNLHKNSQEAKPIVYTDDFDKSSQLKPLEKTDIKIVTLKNGGEKSTSTSFTEKNNETKITIKNPSTHKVNPGESLFSIAKKYHLSVDKLKTLNNLTTTNIQPGQLLTVNANDNEKTAEIKTKTTQKKSENLTHTVQKGESLYSIAKKYKCSVENLKDWNKNLGENIHAGDKIHIKK